MRKHRKMPGWLAELAEKNPTAYRRAITKGARNSARARADTKLRNKKEREEDILAELRREEDERSMREVALARNDHLLPPEDEEADE